MILDTLDNLKQYACINPRFEAVVRFLDENDLNNLTPGRHDIDGDNLYVNIQEAKPRTREEAKLESHQVMIDIQIPLSSSEEMGYAPLSKLKDAPYDNDNDIAFYEETPESYFSVNPGEFVIFFQQDGHAPAISPNGLKKAIFKVRK